MENNFKDLFDEWKLQYQRVNGREFVLPIKIDEPKIDEPKEEWRIDYLKKAIEMYKTLPTYNKK